MLDRRQQDEPKTASIEAALMPLTFKRQPHKMVKHTQTIRRQFADELFRCV